MVNAAGLPEWLLVHFPGLPCSTNRAWRTFGRRWVLSDEYERTKEAVALAVRSQCRRLPSGLVLPWPFCAVNVYLFPPNWREIDVDNRTKTLFDALNQCRFWPDDKCVTRMTVYKGWPVAGGLTVIEFAEAPDRFLWPLAKMHGITPDYLPERKARKK